MNAISRFLVCAVSAATTVDEYYLLEDSAFLTLVDECGQTMTADDAVARLSVYVDENY